MHFIFYEKGKKEKRVKEKEKRKRKKHVNKMFRIGGST